ncbi:MAG: hypothetical protein L3J14_03040 [Flavobacteriaceae bacterium]|nr:hypothetical protein [Flavobacteriaceae bacterium]
MSDMKKAAFKILQIIYGALIMGVVAFLAIVLFLADNLHFTVDMDDVFTIIVPLMTLSGIAISVILNNNFLKMIQPEDTLQTKLSKYQTASIIGGALLEGSALIGVVATFISGNYFFLLFSVILLIVMYMYFPNKQRFAQAAQLSFEEKSKLDTL